MIKKLQRFAKKNNLGGPDIKRLLVKFKRECDWSEEDKKEICTNYMSPYRWLTGRITKISATNRRVLEYIIEHARLTEKIKEGSQKITENGMTEQDEYTLLLTSLEAQNGINTSDAMSGEEFLKDLKDSSLK